jgi:hypothetical protein
MVFYVVTWTNYHLPFEKDQDQRNHFKTKADAMPEVKRLKGAGRDHVAAYKVRIEGKHDLKANLLAWLNSSAVNVVEYDSPGSFTCERIGRR